MPVLRSRAWVAAPVDVAFAFFDDPAHLARLMPPPVRIRVVRVDPSPPREGTEIEFRYGLGPIQRSWLVRYLEHVPNTRIVDETITGPMRRFHHSHTFTPTRRGTWIEDQIDYHVGPGGWVGAALDVVAGLVMRGVFIWRRAMQRRLLKSVSGR